MGLLAGRSRRPLRYVLVGGWNTVFGYASFAGFYWLTTRLQMHYLWATVPAQVVNILNAYLCQRLLVFEAKGSVVGSLLRFSAVYWAFFAINTPLLVLLVSVAGLHPLVAQVVLIVFSAALSYVVHDRFTFRSDAPPA